MQAIRLVFKYLPVSYENPGNEEARTMMHNAACIAAIAFANASVGVNHALAHAFGARFGVAHGRANALMLPHVIAFNAGVPTKFMPSPNQKAYVAHKKYATIADLLGSGRPHRRGESSEADRRSRTVAGPAGRSALHRGSGHLERRLRARIAGSGEERVRRSLLALQSRACR